jgi:redox-sensitive bicupin YhaK (pirin superfamily)
MGLPLKELVVGHGLLVMNTEAEIIQAIENSLRGRMSYIDF